jgi:hypothetical protein
MRDICPNSVTQITSMDLKRHQTTEQTAYILEQDVQ